MACSLFSALLVISLTAGSVPWEDFFVAHQRNFSVSSRFFGCRVEATLVFILLALTDYHFHLIVSCFSSTFLSEIFNLFACQLAFNNLINLQRREMGQRHSRLGISHLREVLWKQCENSFQMILSQQPAAGSVINNRKLFMKTERKAIYKRSAISANTSSRDRWD